MKVAWIVIIALCAPLFLLTARAADTAFPTVLPPSPEVAASAQAQAAAVAAGQSENDPPDPAYAPHNFNIIFYLTGATGKADIDAIHTSVAKLPSASTLDVNTVRGYARIHFDSHVVSYHQIAQAIMDAGTAVGKDYQPFIIFMVKDYATGDNAARVANVFNGKKLNTRVTIVPLDKTYGVFAVHFLPLKIDPSETAPQGFNGGHLHHPVSDPAPRGLALVSGYATKDDSLPPGAVRTLPAKAGAAPDAKSATTPPAPASTDTTTPASKGGTSPVPAGGTSPAEN